jgi:uncharacterized protein
MSFFKELGRFMMAGAVAHAKWELEISRTILGDKRRLFLLGLLLIPIIFGGFAFADSLGEVLPDVLGGKKAYSPAFYSTHIFIISILIGLGAGLITGCIGAGGGFVIAPALMSAGIKGILAVGTDLFHIFAKAIMGSVIHRKLGNVSVMLAVVFLIGAIIGATLGGMINRFFYEINPVMSDAFITTIYSLMLGFLGTYAMNDYLKARKTLQKPDQDPKDCSQVHGQRDEGCELGSLPNRIQSISIPPMVSFDYDFTPGGRKISWVFLVASGALVGLAAGIMGVGGGFLTFPIFVYVLGVSSMTTVGTDIFQIIFTAGYASISQYAIYGFIFYTLAMGMLIGSLIGHSDRGHGNPGGQRDHHPGILRHGRTGRVRQPGFRSAGQAVGNGNPAHLKRNRAALEVFGIWAFFVVIGGFGVWVIGTFIVNIGQLKSREH